MQPWRRTVLLQGATNLFKVRKESLIEAMPIGHLLPYFFSDVKKYAHLRRTFTNHNYMPAFKNVTGAMKKCYGLSFCFK